MIACGGDEPFAQPDARGSAPPVDAPAADASTTDAVDAPWVDAARSIDGAIFDANDAVVADAIPIDAPPPVQCDPWVRPEPQPFPGRPDGLAPLSSVAIPDLGGGDIVDFGAAVRLGKAFFWDTQVGGDGQTACASCHYAAGADARTHNVMSPGPNQIFEENGVTGPDQQASIGNIDTDDRVGSQGVVAALFVGLAQDPTVAADRCQQMPDPLYLDHRQVTERNTPTVIGAVFFRELFWDGRAHHTFNGADPFGDTGNGSGSLAIANAALASQAVGPPNSAVEMACAGRGFNGPEGLGAKLLAREPLQFQRVAPTDSALGCLSAWPEPGLDCGARPCTYRELIAAAFGPELAADAENQFARIWGQALWAYESTLIPDETPLDQYLAGDEAALTDTQKLGLDLFTGKAGCVRCHAGPALSDATVRFANDNGLINVDGGDQGFHHIGVRPTSINFSEDLGRAGIGPGGVSFSVSGSDVDRGAFKTPQLRNVALTAPYFHNGGKATLVDVIDFYAAGGDFPNPSSQLRAINFLPGEAEALVELLRGGLTDCRVENAHAPFDHPSINIPNGPNLGAVGAEGTAPCP